MKLTQKQIRDIFSYYTGSEKYPKNFTRGYFNRNTRTRTNSQLDAVRDASYGDVIKVDVYNRWYWVGTVSFCVEYKQEIEKWVKLNKEWKGRLSGRRDYQRQRVYNFERYMINLVDHSLNYKLQTEEDVVRLYQYIYALLGIDEKTLPEVSITRQNKRTSSHRSWIIKLAEGWGQQLKVVLHELAHDIVDTMKEKESAVAHGKTFVSVILALYEYFIPTWNKELAFSELERRKIKWSKVDYNRMIDALSGVKSLVVAENLSVDRSVALQKFIVR